MVLKEPLGAALSGLGTLRAPMTQLLRPWAWASGHCSSSLAAVSRRSRVRGSSSAELEMVA